MLKLSETHDTLNVVKDQLGSPTSATELARLIHYLEPTESYGVYHATCEGICSWADFAEAIFQKAGKKVTVNHVTTEEYMKIKPQSARRPEFFHKFFPCILCPAIGAHWSRLRKFCDRFAGISRKNIIGGYQRESFGAAFGSAPVFFRKEHFSKMKKILITGANGQLGRALDLEYQGEDAVFIRTDVAESQGITALSPYSHAVRRIKCFHENSFTNSSPAYFVRP